jgi:hypothetical protein
MFIQGIPIISSDIAQTPFLKSSLFEVCVVVYTSQYEDLPYTSCTPSNWLENQSRKVSVHSHSIVDIVKLFPLIDKRLVVATKDRAEDTLALA